MKNSDNYRNAVDSVEFSKDFNLKVDNLIKEKAQNNDIFVKNGFKAIQCKKLIRNAVSVFLALILLAGGFCGYTFNAEAKEYREAAEFFEENDLPTEGLTKDDIKAVYRDITTGKFSNDKTKEVLEKCVLGYEISQETSLPEDAEELWNYKNNIENTNSQPIAEDSAVSSAESNDTACEDGCYITTYENGVTVTEYDNGSEIWTLNIQDFLLYYYTETDDYIVIFGNTHYNSSAEVSYGRIALINKSGKLLWDRYSDNGYRHDRYEKVVCLDDCIMVFGCGDNNILTYTKYDYSGNVLQYTHYDADIGQKYYIYFFLEDIVRLGDGYLIHLYYPNTEVADRLVKLNDDGTFSDSFTYMSDDIVYYIAGMIEYNDKLYLSAYSVPKLKEGESDAGGRYEIAGILNDYDDYIKEYLRNNPQNLGIKDDEKLLQIAKDHYTAILLECDAASGAPNVFYTVGGSLGGDLYLDNSGNLIWETESITEMFYSGWTSSFSLIFSCLNFNYTFNSDGKLVGQEKTDKIVTLYR